MNIPILLFLLSAYRVENRNVQALAKMTDEENAGTAERR
jgi:hypothetical protein